MNITYDPRWKGGISGQRFDVRRLPDRGQSPSNPCGGDWMNGLNGPDWVLSSAKSALFEDEKTSGIAEATHGERWEWRLVEL